MVQRENAGHQRQTDDAVQLVQSVVSRQLQRVLVYAQTKQVPVLGPVAPPSKQAEFSAHHPHAESAVQSAHAVYDSQLEGAGVGGGGGGGVGVPLLEEPELQVVSRTAQ